MTKPTKKDDVEIRMEVLWKLLCENAERELSWLETRTVLQARTNTEHVSDAQLEYCIRRLRDEKVRSPNELKIIGAAGPKQHARIVLHHRESESARREREFTCQKRSIGAVVWHTLLGKYVGPNTETLENGPPFFVMPDPNSKDGWPDKTINRLRRLRQRTFASLALDSGSTVRAIARSLIDTPIMPFEAGEEPFNDDQHPVERVGPAKRTSRLVLPTLITNSPLVVTDILESPNYNRFDVRLIGGNVGGDSAATTGIMAESCLASWGYAGQFVNVDVAVVGTRGYMMDLEGQKGFMVSHLSQANIKSRLFSLAATKCVVLSSNKIRNPEGVCRFARLCAEDVHIVFTDAECKDEVTEFIVEAHAQGVVAVVAVANAKEGGEIVDLLNVKKFQTKMLIGSTGRP